MVGTSGLVIVPAWDLFALDEQTGAARWTFSPDDDYPGADAAVGDDGSLYSVGRYIYRIQPTTGAVVWRADLQEQPFAPVAAGGVVYVGTRAAIPGTSVLGAGHAMALDAATGRVLWKTPIPAPDDPANGGVNGPGALTPDMLIVSSVNGRVYGLDRATGTVRWVYQGDRSYSAGVVMLGDVAVVASAYGKIDGINARTGAGLWRQDVGGHFLDRITTDGNLAYAVNGRLFAVDARGRIAWRYDAGESVPIYTGTALAGGTIFVGADDGFYAVRTRR
jgi:outer membrane protein assembly factor BamB